jgi:phospholipase C
MSKYLTVLLTLTSAANAASLGDVKHVIMLMMENRSFQHVSVYIPTTILASICTLF